MRISRSSGVQLTLAVLAMAAPLLGSPVGSSAGTTTITFTGKPLLGIDTLTCPSTPSAASLTVAPGKTVNFTNRTGRTATLRVGDSQKKLPDKSLVSVTFAHGPVLLIVQMLPDCLLDLGTHTPMIVTVTAGVPALSPTVGPTIAHPTQAPTVTRSTHPATVPPIRSTATPAPAGSLRVPVTMAPSTGADPDFGPVSALEDPPHASGLLTLLATVGVIGLAMAVLRATVARRSKTAGRRR